jgi:hypothetical protein
MVVVGGCSYRVVWTKSTNTATQLYNNSVTNL